MLDCYDHAIGNRYIYKISYSFPWFSSMFSWHTVHEIIVFAQNLGVLFFLSTPISKIGSTWIVLTFLFNHIVRTCWASGRKGRIHLEFFLSMWEENKGEEKGDMIEETTLEEREEYCDKRRKLKKKTRRRHGMRKLH